MSVAKPFTSEEDKQVWEHVLKNLESFSRGSDVFWNDLVPKNGRSSGGLRRRFSRIHTELHKTEFSVEDKLKLAVKLGIVVNKDFLEESRKHAELTVENGVITAYKLIRNAPKKFTVEEDKAIWKYALKNSDMYTGSNVFWKQLVVQLKSDRKAVRFHERFQILVRKLHEADLRVEDKLKLYRDCRIKVYKEFLKTLEEKAELGVENGYIFWYQLKENRAGRRGNTSGNETQNPPKRSRIQEDEDVVFDRVVQMKQEPTEHEEETIKQEPAQPVHLVEAPVENQDSDGHEQQYVDPKDEQIAQMHEMIKELKEQNEKQAKEMKEQNEKQAKEMKDLMDQQLSAMFELVKSIKEEKQAVKINEIKKEML